MNAGFHEANLHHDLDSLRKMKRLKRRAKTKGPSTYILCNQLKKAFEQKITQSRSPCVLLQRSHALHDPPAHTLDGGSPCYVQEGNGQPRKRS